MTLHRRILATLLAVLACSPAPAAFAQVQSIDPNSAIDGDLAPRQGAPRQAVQEPQRELAPTTPPASGADYATPTGSEATAPRPSIDAPWTPPSSSPVATDTPPPAYAPQAPAPATYHQDDLIGAAEGVFGKGSRGLAKLIQDILKKQGEPVGYITGREAGGAIVVGLRYGSGTLHHKIEGERPVYWTGPSIGFDAGANAANTFVLVYNLSDTQDLFKRYGAGEGQAYFVGGFHVSYLRRGDVVLIPVRVGAGLRLGINAGYMKFSEKQRWIPF